ncbi:MAG: AhpC/TSA family protein [Bacteroidetes bacterium]|nr:AhpC/TSA family protein [Bacteroidota bacterium]
MLRTAFVFAFLLPLSLLAQTSSRAFVIEGKLIGFDPLSQKIQFQYRGAQGWKMDSVVVEGGQFRLEGNIVEPTLARLMIRSTTPGTKNLMKEIFLMPGRQRVSMTADAKRFQVRGSEAHRAFEKLKKKSAGYDAQYESLIGEYQSYGKAKETAKQAMVEEKLGSIDALRRENVYRRFLIQTSNTPISPYVLQEYAGWDIDPASVEPLYNLLSNNEKQYPSMIEFKQSLDMAKRTQVGVAAMEFVQNDTLDQPIALSSFRGKYVLVDFWSSWCGPCRVENPNVVKAFETYRDRNFQVLGVSLDRPGQKDKWMKAIHDDKLAWTHVSDLKFWNNAVAVQYGIRAIPQNLLIDPNGMIVGKNFRGEKLMRTLEKMLK